MKTDRQSVFMFKYEIWAVWIQCRDRYHIGEFITNGQTQQLCTANYIVLFVYFLRGCSSNSIKTRIVNVPNEKWRITSVVVSKSGDAWRVSGRLNAPNIFGLPDGHIVVSVLSDNEILLDQKRVGYWKIVGSGRPSRHQFSVVLFAVDFGSISRCANVVVEFYINKSDASAVVLSNN